MLSKAWIDRSPIVEAPRVGAVNFQVRTGVSAPFEPHMTGEDGRPVVAPQVGSVNFQVRTGVSVPFEPDMADEDQARSSPPPATPVRVPGADFMIVDRQA